MMEPGMLFKGDITIECKKKALQEAKKYITVLVLWADGSKLDQGNVRVAVCWRDERLNQWKEKYFFLGENKEILDAELWAVSEALNIARKETLNAKDILIKIFCDS